MRYKTIRWKWIEPLEQPTVANIISREMMSKSNIFGQITVRMHSKQTLAVYDRFGRLAFGDENAARDVLEYVVFEKHLTDLYSSWRLHDKIEPEWAQAKSPVIRTYVMPKPFIVDESVDESEASKFKKDDSHLKDDNEQPAQKALADKS
jgi:large subunit ribosomal protein L45